MRPTGTGEGQASVYRVAVVLESGRILALGALAGLAPAGLPNDIGNVDLASVLERDPDLASVREALEVAGAEALEAAALDPATVRLAAPTPRPGKIVGVGYNYLAHVREQGRERPVRPVLFSMFANAVIADGDAICKPAGTHALDLEAELAVVIGRRASRVSPDLALRHVAGYTVANDVTARDWQGQAKALRAGEQGDGQWLRAKGSDTFLPLGPCLVTADELGDGRGLAVRSWLTRAADAATGPTAGPAAGPVAGRPFQMQHGDTADLLFSVAELIAIISAEVTLDPGDVIVTGTPSGVGVFREPPIFLEPGDLVRVEVERIGSLTSPITDEDGHAPAGSPAARFLAGA
jgi:2-keto-4-pentenoate hydratase/2-oxohepta-3-ene-1,7-dioic acid hydratase in catechol pathway